MRRLHAELAKIIRGPELKASLWDRQWIDPVGSTPEELAALIKSELVMYGKLVKQAGIKSE